MDEGDIADSYYGDWASSVPHSRKRRFAREAGIFIYSGNSMIYCNLQSFYTKLKRNYSLTGVDAGAYRWPLGYGLALIVH